MLILPVTVFQHQPHVLFRYIPGQLMPVVDAVVGDLLSIFFVGFGPSDGVVAVVADQHGIDHGNIKTGVVKHPGHRQIIIACGLHHDACFSRQRPEGVCQVLQIFFIVADFKYLHHHFTAWAHDRNGTFAFGNINANGIHFDSSYMFRYLGAEKRCNKRRANSLKNGHESTKKGEVTRSPLIAASV